MTLKNDGIGQILICSATTPYLTISFYKKKEKSAPPKLTIGHFDKFNVKEEISKRSCKAKANFLAGKIWFRLWINTGKLTQSFTKFIEG